MDSQSAKTLVIDTFENGFNKAVFLNFVKNLVKKFDESKAVHFRGYIKDKFKQTTKAIKTYERLGTYTDPEGKTVDILIVYLEKAFSLDYARTTLRNFVAEHLKDRNEKDAALVAFVPPQTDDWRFSLVKMEYQLEKTSKGQLKAKTKLTPAKRFSFLVGKNENSYTAKKQFLPLLTNDQPPLLSEFESSFNVEKVTKEFFAKYHDLFNRLKELLDNLVKKDEKIKKDFDEKKIDTVDFSKKLLGQIVFLYFLQKKGWFGVDRDKDWGTGSKQFLRQLFNGNHGQYKNFFNDVLEPLFYQALRTDRSFDDNYFSQFNCKIPFLNGGLFDPINDYDWIKTDILLPNNLFSNNNLTKEGDSGDGILDIFDRYNFTVKEDEPLEKEVAIDPEMLGKVFENLLAVKDRKSKGTYYTPREIVHYMCQQSLINYLVTELKTKVNQKDIETLIKYGETTVEHDKEASEKEKTAFKLPKDIIKYAQLIDDKLADIRVCDPAVGSGAFLVGMMSEVVKARNALTNHLKNKENRNPYDFKRQAIEKSLYGVDIDLGAVEIAKLRLWLSLIVDEEDIKQIKPLPNLDYKIMQGNSLIEYIDPKAIAKTADHVRSPLIDKFNQAKQEYLSTYEPGQKKAKRNEINKLIEDIMIYDKKREIETDKVWKIYQQNQQDNLFGEDNKQLAFSGLSEKEKEKINKQIQEFNQLQSLSPIDHFEWHLNFNEIFDDSNGFDIVVANPPYVSHDKILIKTRLKNSYSSFEPFADLYCYFIELGLNLQNQNGVLCFITSNSYLRAEYGKRLREKILKENNILTLININDYQLFGSAIVNTSILICKKNLKGKNDANRARIVNKSFIEVSNFDDFVILNSFFYHQNDFESKSWNLLTPEKNRLKKKLEAKGKTLEELKTKIRLGLATGSNEAFLIYEERREQFIKEDNNNSKLIKPLLRGKDIYRYGYKHEGLYIILAKNGVDLKKDYPSLYKYLDSFGEKFKKRGARGQNWWNLRACAFFDDFKKEKIVWIELNDYGRFALVEDEIYLVNSAYFLIPPEKIQTKFLLGILNSSVIRFYLSTIAETSGMGVYRWINNYVKEFPIPVISQKKQIVINETVNQILKITTNVNYDPKNPPPEQKLLETKIDRMVYKLYGLSPEETEIVEGNTN